MNSNSIVSIDFIKELKQQILASRYVVAKIANAESLRLYFNAGKIIDEKAKAESWGAKVLDAVSDRLQQELPGLRGFSSSNLKKMRIFYQAWKDSTLIGSLTSNQLNVSPIQIGSMPTNQLLNENEMLQYFVSVSFSHHFEIISVIKKETDKWYYIKNAALKTWTVNQLRIELRNQSHLQINKIPNNFAGALPPTLSNKAIHAFKDQYLLDFVNIEDADEMDERVLEQEIVQNIKKFLMSLGNDFCFLGNQYRLLVSEEEYFIDLLFFHRGLQCLVAFELKRGKFKPEYIGKMNFYLSALDELVKQPHENPSIGIILCKEKDNKKVEYSFRDINKPMGVSTYKTSEKLPTQFRQALPDAETLMRLLE